MSVSSDSASNVYVPASVSDTSITMAWSSLASDVSSPCDMDVLAHQFVVYSFHNTPFLNIRNFPRHWLCLTSPVPVPVVSLREVHMSVTGTVMRSVAVTFAGSSNLPG